MKAEPLEQITASNSSLAQLLNLSVRRIQQLVQAKLLPAPGPEGHRIIEAVPAYLRLLQQPTRTANLSEARQKLIEVQTQIQQIELRQKSGELVLREAVEKKWFQLTRIIRDGFLNLPARTAGLVCAERNQQKCHDLLAEEVRQILEGLSSRAGNGAEVRPVPPPRSPRKKDPPPTKRRDV